VKTLLDSEAELDAGQLHENLVTQLVDLVLIGDRVKLPDPDEGVRAAARLAEPVRQLLARAAGELWTLERFRLGVAELVTDYRGRLMPGGVALGFGPVGRTEKPLRRRPGSGKSPAGPGPDASQSADGGSKQMAL